MLFQPTRSIAKPVFAYLFPVSVLLISPLSFAQPPQACDCLWQGSFSQITDKADLIISGKIIARKGNSADINLDHTHFDRGINFTEFKQQIRIWGDDGKQCRPNIGDFPVGTRWVMALKKITENKLGGFNPNTPNVSYGRINDYYLSKCGAYWLTLNEGYVTGNLVKGRRWQWDNKKMNPVILELIDAYIKDIIPEQALIEAAKPLTETKKLMQETKNFIHGQ
ncbi:MAG: hypothetical protein V3T17_04625 [Pseudomonadales bacterium]